MALTGSIGVIAAVTNFALFVAFGVVNAAVVAQRRRAPVAHRPFRSPGALPFGRLRWVPVLPLIGIATAGALLFSLDRASLAGGAALLVIGVGLALVLRERHRAVAAGAATAG